MKNFGNAVTRLINKNDFTYEEMYHFFRQILQNIPSEMHQGAFLAALASKTETITEARAVFDCIMKFDTNKVKINSLLPVIDNSGTGMDEIKTFNISSAAAIIASAEGAMIARHGSRGITSSCGTIDIMESIGIGVEVPVDIVKKSIEEAGIGIFNGASPTVHPKALGRILSKISFGSVLNIAASLANPTSPQVAVRGVYNPKMVLPVAEMMQEIGFKRALVIHCYKNDGGQGIDEAGTIGENIFAELKNDSITTGKFSPEDFGIKRTTPEKIMSLKNIDLEKKRFIRVLSGCATRDEIDIVALNAGLIIYVADISDSIQNGIKIAYNSLSSKRPIEKLRQWVKLQNFKGETKVKEIDMFLSSVL